MLKKLISVMLGCAIVFTASAGTISAFADSEQTDASQTVSLYESVTQSMNSADALGTVEAANEVKNYVEDNFFTFIGDCNASGCVDEIQATYIEYSHSVYIIEYEIYGVYLDFNGDNGYAVVAENCYVYGLESSGDLFELRDGRDLMFSMADGFVYFDENGSCRRVYEVEIEDIVYSDSTFESSSASSSDIVYPGQDEAGDGEIAGESIDDYIAERYPAYTYVTKNEELSTDFTCTRQEPTSYYIKYNCDKNGVATSGGKTEGNCALNAMLNVVRGWAKELGLSNIGYDDIENVLVGIKDDPLYSVYGIGTIKSTNSSSGKNSLSAEEEETKYYYWAQNNNKMLENMSKLYVNIRSYSIDQYGYTPEAGFNSKNVPDTIETVVQKNYETILKTEYVSTISEAITSIDNGKTVYMSINGSETYGNHGVALIGYQQYVYTIKFGMAVIVLPFYFYQIADGWNDEPMYFDPNTSANPTLNFVILEEY